METKVAIIDADSIIWTTAYLNRDELGCNLTAMDDFIRDMLVTVGATHYIGYRTNGTITHREASFKSYKQNRPPKPDWFNKHRVSIEWHMWHVWQMQNALPGYEADDMVAAAARVCREKGMNYVICGIDKDLLQIPGEHYDYKKKTFQTVNQSCDRTLFTQVLTGDATDNIGGCPGIGPEKVKKLFSDIKYEFKPDITEYAVRALYTFIKKLGERPGIAKFAETYLLVRLKEDLEIPWNPISFSPPEVKQEEPKDPFA